MTSMAQNFDSVSFDTLAVAPVMSREKFANLVGLPVGVIIGWAGKGLIPTISIGRYSLINVALLQKQCLSREFLL